jgi:hypothetical protein
MSSVTGRALKKNFKKKLKIDEFVKQRSSFCVLLIRKGRLKSFYILIVIIFAFLFFIS